MSDVVLKQEGSFVSIIVSDTLDMEAIKDDANYNVVDRDSLPKDRIFRDAWMLNGRIDLEKAKDIWRDKIRVQRNIKLKDLDIQWMKAMESGNIKKASSIAHKKQTLREITEREELENAKTVEEIKAFWPDELKG